MTIPVAINAQFKQNYGRCLRRALVLAVLFHTAALTLSPPFEFKPYEPPPEPVMEVVVPAKIVLPEPPAKVEHDIIPEPAPDDDVDDSPELPITSPDDPNQFARTPTQNGPETSDYIWFTEPPQLIDFVRPKYPDLAREAGIAGLVRVEVLVGADGKVETVSILTSDVTAAMERSALEAARKCLFNPAKQGTLPVKARVMVPFHFILD